MLTVSSLSKSDLASRLAGEGIRLRTGCFTTRLQGSLPALTNGVAQLYADYTLAPDDAYAHFHLQLRRPRLLRRWYRPQVDLLYDGRRIFLPLPLPQALPMLEWGMNWCISTRAHRYLMIHAAVMERGGQALILPAPPGSGKSTLTAALVGRGGWRLLSDELTLLRLEDGLLIPNPRPVSLKNESIDVIRHYLPDAVLSPPVTGTIKGTVALMRPPTASVLLGEQTAVPAWVVFPRYETGAATELTPLPPAQAFMELADNAFNYTLLAQRGFHAMGHLIDRVQAYRFRYSALDEALDRMSRLAPRS
jgi:HprK-related kinase A